MEWKTPGNGELGNIGIKAKRGVEHRGMEIAGGMGSRTHQETDERQTFWNRGEASIGKRGREKIGRRNGGVEESEKKNKGVENIGG